MTALTIGWHGAAAISKEDISSLIRCSFGVDRFYPGFFRQNASQAPPALAEGQRAQIETRAEGHVGRPPRAPDKVVELRTASRRSRSTRCREWHRPHRARRRSAHRAPQSVQHIAVAWALRLFRSVSAADQFTIAALVGSHSKRASRYATNPHH